MYNKRGRSVNNCNNIPSFDCLYGALHIYLCKPSICTIIVEFEIQILKKKIENHETPLNQECASGYAIQTD